MQRCVVCQVLYERGKTEVLEEGKAKGEKQKAAQIVINLLQKGNETEDIAEITGLIYTGSEGWKITQL